MYKVERSAEAFYRRASLESTNEQVRHFAQQFADEEHQHAEAANRMKAKLPEIKSDFACDFDQPTMPE